MDIQDFTAIAVVGAILSVVIQGIKNTFGTDSGTTKILTIGLAILVGSAYVWIRSTQYFQTVVLVLTTASAVYALLLK